MRGLDPNVSTPAVRQIADAIRDAVRSGEFRSAGRIPGQAELIAHFGVAKATLNTAIRTLKSEGLLVGRQGVGVFIHTDGGESIGPRQEIDRLTAELAELRRRVEEIERRLSS